MFQRYLFPILVIGHVLQITVGQLSGQLFDAR